MRPPAPGPPPALVLEGAELEREVVGSKHAPEGLTSADDRAYQYSYGVVSREETRKLVHRTYLAACTTRVALAGKQPDFYAPPRVDAHYLRRLEPLRRTLETRLGAYLVARRIGSRARRASRKDYGT
jgi:hypothetical protein